MARASTSHRPSSTARRTLQKVRDAVVACSAVLALTGGTKAQEPPPAASPQAARLSPQWDKLFAMSETVDHRKIIFTNRYGIALAADLYMPKNRGDRGLAALVVDGPFGAVKEQAAGYYAQSMAERGFVTLAFDRSYTGESGGYPRNLASPEINTDDVSAAVDYIGLLPEVDQQRIGTVGICGGAGMSLNAAAVDKRIKAMVAISLYDISRLMAKGYNDKLDLAGRTAMLEHLSQQRWVDARNGNQSPGPEFLPRSLDDLTDPVVRMYFDYYRTPRGYHPRSLNSLGAFAGTMPIAFINTPMLTRIAEISPRPILFIAGDRAHSRYFTDDAYRAAAEPKQLLIIDDAIHTDLYDRAHKIPFDVITSFFKRHLMDH